MDSSQKITSSETCYSKNRVCFSCPQQRNSIPHVFIANMAKTSKKKSEMTGRNGCQKHFNWLPTFGDSECKKKLRRKIINVMWRKNNKNKTRCDVIPDSEQWMRRNIIQSVISFCLNYHERIEARWFDDTRNYSHIKFAAVCWNINIINVMFYVSSCRKVVNPKSFPSFRGNLKEGKQWNTFRRWLLNDKNWQLH